MKIILYGLLMVTDVFALAQAPSATYKLLGQYILENGKQFKGTTVGGLSGIEYDSGNVFYLISDDPGAFGPARAYRALIRYGKNKIEVEMLDLIRLQAPEGMSFSSSREKADKGNCFFSDGESIRYDRGEKRLIWSSEGGGDKEPPCQPFIFSSDTAGTFLNILSTDQRFTFQSSGSRGLQRNAVFEALALLPGKNMLVYCTEKSLLEDVSNMNDTLKPVRISIADKYSGQILHQFVYLPDNTFMNNSNGVVELLAVSADTLLVLERAYDKLKGNAIRLYRAMISKTTTDVKNVRALKNKKYQPLRKELLLDFSSLALNKLDNIEGMTWYPLERGKTGILFISDNNFNDTQITQLLLVEWLR